MSGKGFDYYGTLLLVLALTTLAMAVVEEAPLTGLAGLLACYAAMIRHRLGGAK